MSDVKVNLSESISELGLNYKFDFYEANTYKSLKKLTSAYGSVINDRDEILLVSQDNSKWSLPGGQIEQNETPENAFIREVMEETAIKINPDTVHLLMYFKSYKSQRDSHNLNFYATQLIFIGKVLDMYEFKIDSGGNEKYRKFVPIAELTESLSWISPRVVRFISEILIDKLKN